MTFELDLHALAIGTRVVTVMQEYGTIIENKGYPWYYVHLTNPWGGGKFAHTCLHHQSLSPYKGEEV